MRYYVGENFIALDEKLCSSIECEEYGCSFPDCLKNVNLFTVKKELSDKVRELLLNGHEIGYVNIEL